MLFLISMTMCGLGSMRILSVFLNSYYHKDVGFDLKENKNTRNLYWYQTMGESLLSFFFCFDTSVQKTSGAEELYVHFWGRTFMGSFPMKNLCALFLREVYGTKKSFVRVSGTVKVLFLLRCNLL